MFTTLKNISNFFLSLNHSKKISLLVLALVILVIPLSLTALEQKHELRKKAAEENPSLPKPEVVPGKIIVRFRGQQKAALRSLASEEVKTPTRLEMLKQTYGVKEVRQLRLPTKFERSVPGTRGLQEIKDTEQDSIATLSYTSKAEPLLVAKEFTSLPTVAWAEPVYVYRTTQDKAGGGGATPTIQPTPTTTDCVNPPPPNDPYYCSGEQWAPSNIQAKDAWALSTGSSEIKVAVIDTGVEATHEDLRDNLLLPGKDFVNYDDDPNDDTGHGTHVAGTIGAIGNNKKGAVGINWSVKILPGKVCAGWGCPSDAIAEGISWAVNQGARVINLSLGGSIESQLITEAIMEAYDHNVVVVAAVGNANASSEYFFPASSNHVIGVAATNKNDQFADFSNWGSTVDVSAPGVDVLSTIPSGTYGKASGTSMASPHVAGLAALILAKQPNLKPEEVEAILENSADDLGESEWDMHFGWGRINASRALSEPNTTSLPTAMWEIPKDGALVAQNVTLSFTIKGDTKKIEQSTLPEGPWSQDGITLQEPQETDSGELVKGVFRAPDNFEGNLYFRLTVESSGKQKVLTRNVLVDSNLSEITLPITEAINITTSDINNDGEEELVLTNGWEVLAIKQDGTLLPGWPQRIDPLSGHILYYKLAVGEVDPNYPGLEIVATSLDAMDPNGSIQLVAWHADGTAVNGWPVVGIQANVNKPNPVLGDLNNDGINEVIYAETYAPTPKLHVFNNEGVELPGFPTPLERGIASDKPLLTDLDGDGNLEIIVYVYGDRGHSLIAINNNAKPVPGWPIQVSDGVYQSILLTGDINSDQKDEILVFQNDILGFLGGRSILRVIDGGGNTIATRTFPTQMFQDFSPQLIIANVLGDSKAEIILSGLQELFVLNEKLENLQDPIGQDMDYTLDVLAKHTGGENREVYTIGFATAQSDMILSTYQGNGQKLELKSLTKISKLYSEMIGSQSPSRLLLLDYNWEYGPSNANTLVRFEKEGGAWEWQQRFSDSKLTSRYNKSEILPTPTPTLTPTPTPTPIAADINKDGCVGRSDLDTWVSEYKNEASGSGSLSDINSDGAVNLLDYNEWFVALRILPKEKICEQ
ncbi:MAG: S8 family serine peptidase [Candidatus Blackburnbacteria bacterium]|nr:S8 family serine peptidase [Candidatus Blackburnbacteria bacterium]